MPEAVLILWLAGSGITFKPLNVQLRSMPACWAVVESIEARGHTATCRRAASLITFGEARRP